MNQIYWNPWHGCIKKSEGCENCYVYQQDATYDKDASEIHLVKSKFKLPIEKDTYREYKVPAGTNIATCFTSDFFLEEADEWRPEAWKMIEERDDLLFFIITKRPERIEDCLPSKWGDGWDNVFINVTAENQKRADERIPILLSLPIKKKGIAIAPILEDINIDKYLKTGEILSVSAGGETGQNARLCNFDWILNIRKQCIENNVDFRFHQTGSNFYKDGKIFTISHKDEFSQANKANINFNKRK